MKNFQKRGRVAKVGLGVSLNRARNESSSLTSSFICGRRRREPSSLFNNTWFAAWRHAAYKFSSWIGAHCRPGALTGRLFQRAPIASLVCVFGVFRRHPARVAPAFTLIELLVVIAVVAILASLLLPALSRSKRQALRAGCLNNIRQLQICSHLYALDHSDRLPPNNYLYDNDTGAPIAGASAEITWCPGWARYDTTTTNIEKGLLFPYSRSAAIYRCPADKSSVQTTNGAPLALLRKRSYSLSIAINGQPTTPNHVVWPPSFQTESE